MVNFKRLSERVRRWGGKVSYSLVDQALFSGANFALSILLGRWVTPAQYGAYTIAFSIFLFLTGLYGSIMLEPMRVIGPGKYAHDLPSYFAAVLRFNRWPAALPGLLALMAGIALAFARSPLAGPMISLGASFAIILAFWLYRQACYTALRPELAAAGSLLYALLLLAGLGLLRATSLLNVSLAFPLTALAGLAPVLVLRRRLGLIARPGHGLDAALVARDRVTSDRVTSDRVAREHWHYGGWILLASLAYSIATLIYPALIGSFVGLEPAGAYRAMQNLVSPLQQGLLALTSLALPAMARRASERGAGYAFQATRKLTVLYLVVSVFYLGALLLGGRALVGVIYAQAAYLPYTWLLGYIGVATLLFSLSQSLAINLRALENTRSIFWSKFYPALFMLLVGIALTWRLGLVGVAISLVTGALIELVVLAVFIARYPRAASEGPA